MPSVVLESRIISEHSNGSCRCLQARSENQTINDTVLGNEGSGKKEKAGQRKGMKGIRVSGNKLQQ